MNQLCNSYQIVNDTMTWIVAIYVRLSREDEKDDKYKGQSESIENQIKFLKSIVNKMGWILFDVYIDDGYTGTNFNRPAFQRMIADVEKKNINLIITKDLSRLGRDYIETGRYLEKYFPKKRVRYIAVNDNIDTFDNSNVNNDMTPFKSVFNDMYAKDISKKVRTSITTKAIEGECIKAFLPYGYKKDANNKNEILIDENVADNVKIIFNLYRNGYGKTEIARYLNNLSIKTPLQYKQENTNYYNPNIKSTYMWNSTVINKILRDRIYKGDLVQLKYRKINYKVQKMEKVPVDRHIVIENNHPAIIDRKIFDEVQEMLDKKSNEWNYSARKKHLLAGLVFCKCGSRVSYNKNHGKYFRCICSSYKQFGKQYCANVHLREDELIKRVTESLHKNIVKYLDIKDLKYNEPNKNIDNKKEIFKLSNKKEEINRLISNLYEDKIAGVISQDTFGVLIKKYEKMKGELDKQINELKRVNEETTNLSNYNREEFENIMKEILSFETINEDNRSLVFKLIDKIIIDDKTVNIKYKFNNMALKA